MFQVSMAQALWCQLAADPKGEAFPIHSCQRHCVFFVLVCLLCVCVSVCVRVVVCVFVCLCNV